MLYDIRPQSEGGNRGAGDTFQLVAPAGKYRVVSVDTFDGEDGFTDYDTYDQALANAKGGNMLRVYVYDDQSNQLHKDGTF